MLFSYYLFTLQVISFFLLCFISWSIFLAIIGGLIIAELIVRKLRSRTLERGEEETLFVCESEFICSDAIYPHLSLKELCFYNEIPKKFLNTEEDHCLVVQKNLNSNKYEVIKKYNKREIRKDSRIKDSKNRSDLNAFFARLNQLLEDSLKVVYESKDLWKAVKKANEIYMSYYGRKIQTLYTPCLHREPSVAPFCVIV